MRSIFEERSWSMSVRFWVPAGMLAVALGAGLVSSQATAAGTEAPQHLTTSLDDQTELSLTVYNSNLALIRDVRQLQLARGASDLHFMDIARPSIPPRCISDR
jgi:hypothetical protein